MFKSCTELKDSEVEYIGSIPESWKIIRNKHIFKRKKVIVGSEWDKYNVLSLTKRGVIIKDVELNEGKMPSDFSIYQIVHPDNLLMCLFDIDVTPRCVGYIENKGIVSAAYTELSAKDKIHMKYYYWWYLMLDIDKQLLHLSKNLRNSLSTDDFMALHIIKPPLSEQKQIANYLDKKTAKIDNLIAKNEELIQLLEEKRVSLINQVITKGLNLNVQMKESGIEWIGEIPKHWNVNRIKDYLQFNIGGTPSTKVDEYFEGDNIWVSISDISKNNGEYIYDSSIKISNEGVRASNVKLIKKNSLLYSFKLSVGLTAFAGCDLYTNEAIASFEENEYVDLNFLKYIFKNGFENNANENIYGAKLFNSDLIKSSQFAMPQDLNEQKQIANYLDKKTAKINNIITKITENINLLEEYKNSLIHHVVTGKIDVRGEKI